MEMNKEQQDALNAFIMASLPEKDKEISIAMGNLVDSLNMAMIGIDNRLVQIINLVNKINNRQLDQDQSIKKLYEHIGVNHEQFIKGLVGQDLKIKDLYEEWFKILKVTNKKAPKTIKKDKEKPSILDDRIDKYAMSKRTLTVLRNGNIITLRELASKTEKEILKLENFGKSTLRECNELLEACKLKFGMTFND